jgi:DNA helicase-2/ATP-dependent DNA helicase PcrA
MTESLDSFLSTLNEPQRAAVLSESSRLLLLAGAGSGKTRVITAKIAHLVISKGFWPSSILAVTFTNKAAREMKERLAELVPGADELTVRTFHSFCAWLLRRNGTVLGLHRNFVIYDEEDSQALLKTIWPARDRRTHKRLAGMISRAKDFGLTPDDDLSDISSDPDLKTAFKLYEEKIRKTGNVDFGDLISLAVKLLRENPEIRNRFRQKFRAVLVDEYQDSNYMQFSLLKELSGDDTTLCVVGDDDQSIYRFRGALVENILDFPREFPGTEIIRLEENYRSTGNILGIASDLISHNRNRMGKTLWCRKPEGLKARVLYCEDQEQEAVQCADIIAREGNPGGTAILYRTNAQSRVFEKRLRMKGIPYMIVGSISFYAREEIKDALAYLSLLLNPADEIAFRRILNKPARGLSKKTEEKLVDQAATNGIDFLSACRQPNLEKKPAVKSREFADYFTKWSDGSDANLGELIKRVIRDSALWDYYQEADKSDSTSRSANLEELVSAAADFEPGEEGLAGFLELIALDQSALDSDDNQGAERVTLITMHNTKGLEFDNVFITGLEQGLFPREEDEAGMEEERRLFYVAITRARESLTITSCRRRLVFGRFENLQPSKFLQELPEERLVVVGTAAVKDTSPYRPGMQVYHDDYGSGVINKVVDNGGHTAIHIRFESGKTGMFLPEFCRHKLEIMGSP